MSSARPTRQPWPMKWIALAIVLFIGLYTFLTLHFRKPGRSYEPYHDMRERANTGRLLAAGYRRIELSVRRPADERMPANTTYPAQGGLPTELRNAIVTGQSLPADILEAHADPTVSRTADYDIAFRCTTTDDKQALGLVDLYVKGDAVVIAPKVERLTGGLQARSRETFGTIVVPAGTLPPGTYHVTFAAERTSRTWTFQVR